MGNYPCVRGYSGGRSHHTCFVTEPPMLYAFRPYCTRQLEYKLQIPAAKPPTEGWPLVIFIHGGAWRIKIARRMAMAGCGLPEPLGDAVDTGKCAVALISYRLTSEAGEWGEETPVTWPAQYEDVLEQVQDIIKKASEYNLDATRIGLWGESAGAYLAVMLATRGVKEKNLSIKACVDLFGATVFAEFVSDIGKDPAKLQGPWEYPGGTFEEPQNAEPAEALMGFPMTDSSKSEHAEALASANPLNYFSSNMPAFFIAHGDNDPMIPTNQSARMHQALTKAGYQSQFRIVEGGSHGPVSKAHGEVPTEMPKKEAADFLMKYLVKP